MRVSPVFGVPEAAQQARSAARPRSARACRRAAGPGGPRARRPVFRPGRAPWPARAPGRSPSGSVTLICPNPILDGFQVVERARRERSAHGHDQLDQADAAEPGFDRVIIADDAGLGPKQIDVIGFIAQTDTARRPRARRWRRRRGRSPADGGKPGESSRFIKPATGECEPCRTGISRRNGGSMAIGEISMTRIAAAKVHVARIAPNCWIGTTSLVTSAP